MEIKKKYKYFYYKGATIMKLEKHSYVFYINIDGHDYYSEEYRGVIECRRVIDRIIDSNK